VKPVVILVSPKGAGNVGSVARLMANFELENLRIVDPRCDLYSDECRMMSLKAYPLIGGAKIFENLQAAQQDIRWSYAFSARDPSSTAPALSLPELVSSEVHSRGPEESYAFVFGREDNGLTADEIRLCDQQVWIPVEESYSSLNLSSAVGMALYSDYLSRSSTCSKPNLLRKPLKETEEVFFDRLTELLQQIGFLNPKTSWHILEDIRNLYHRAKVEERELRIIFGILSDLERSLKSSRQ